MTRPHLSHTVRRSKIMVTQFKRSQAETVTAITL
uniref:Uncharacterized protein n=1 Tax=Anguilla anguilla TaxID=7936 RepID=A0A0E9UM48_ANGAN